MYGKQTILNISVMFIGILLIIYGTITSFFLKDIIRLYTKKLLTLSPSMKFYNEWKDMSVPIINRIYLFNFTNPDDFERNGSKPIMKEMGPYTYKEYQKRVNITWNSNGTVTYKMHRVWYFDPELSNGTPNDSFTSFSSIPAFAARQVTKEGYFIQKGLSMVLTAAGEKMSVTTTADVFLFKGYSYSLSIAAPYFEKTMKRVGAFHTFNDSTLRDGVTNIDTGASDIKQAAKVKYWNYSPYQLQAGLITGTNGELYPSGVEKTNITMFTGWTCKDLHFDYDSEEWVDGIRGYKFIISGRNIDNGSIYEENLISWPEERFPSGILNLSLCYYNGIVVGSLPHFFMADPYYANQVEGMMPDIKKHQSYIIIEPNSGVLLKARFGAQINYLVRRYKNIRLYQNIPRVTIYPLLWLEKSIELPKSIFNFLKMFLVLVRVAEITALPCLIIGIFILSTATIWNLRVQYKTHLECYRCRFLWRRFKKKDMSLAASSSARSKKDNYYFRRLPQKVQEIETGFQKNTQGLTP